MTRRRARYCPVRDAGFAAIAAGGPSATMPPPVNAGPRSHVDDVIGAVDRLFVVLDDDDGVADAAQVLEGIEETAVVALVQPDRGFVKDVRHADESGADLAREPDALGLSTGERLRRARRGRGSRAPRPTRNRSRCAISLRIRLAIAPLAPPSSNAAKNSWAVRIGKAARAAASHPRRTRCGRRLRRAPPHDSQGRGAEVLGEIVADHARLRLPVPALHVGDHAFERMFSDVVSRGARCGT